MKLSIIIPIYNEEKLLPEVLRRVRALPVEKELILVNDASVDGTHKILEEELKKYPENTIVLTHTHNQGKGAAIRTGLKRATGDIVIIQDADLEYNPEEILGVIQPIIEGKTRVAYGSRFLGEVKRMRLANYVANKILAWLVSILYGQKITDEATAYKAFRREVIQQIDLKC
ncbi:MAG: glycosyltransferase family 2 protein, partial [Candidatus Sumerlaeia bacterium]|nr:glycosyltransferase family 2 protein [Candidatus Sumerlaeia bacterium]